MKLPAAAVPTSTQTTPAPSVLGRAASQKRPAVPGFPMRGAMLGLGPPGGGVDARLALLQVGVAALLLLLVHVEEEGGVAGELLDARQAVGVGVEGRLEQSEGQRAHLEDAPAPGDGLLLEAVEGHHLVDEAHPQGLLGVVLLAEEPDLPGLFRADLAGEQAGPVASVERTDLRPHLPEAGIVGGDGGY